MLYPVSCLLNGASCMKEYWPTDRPLSLTWPCNLSLGPSRVRLENHRFSDLLPRPSKIRKREPLALKTEPPAFKNQQKPVVFVGFCNIGLMTSRTHFRSPKYTQMSQNRLPTGSPNPPKIITNPTLESQVSRRLLWCSCRPLDHQLVTQCAKNEFP